MEFKFNVNDIFKQPIVEINNNLVPPGFTGDRRALWDALGKVSEVINTMGEASASAQGLSKPITTAERLRNSEHKLYFLIDQDANNGKGAVTGMLKTGKKGLYVFDREGQHYQVSPPCILDFYIHESRQRTGLGKHLFEHMLQKEETEPVKMAIDRPSEKLLGFLNKHYQLNTPVKQMNNYVVFDGFFPKSSEQTERKSPLGKKESANGLQKFTSPQGRYGAPRPPCSMGQIIHNQTTNYQNVEPTGIKSVPATNYQRVLPEGSCPQNVSQSTPNLGIGQRILNNAYNQNQVNANFNQNYNTETHNLQNLQSAAGAIENMYLNQNTAVPTDPTQYYSSNQPIMVASNQNQVQFAQNMIPNQYAANNLSATNMQSNLMAFDNHQNLVPHQTNVHQQSPNENIQQPMQMVSAPNVNYPKEHQLQRIASQQNYTHVNQQFQNMNLNNQVASSNPTINSAVPMQHSSNPQFADVDGKNMYQDQQLSQPMQSNVGSEVRVPAHAGWNQSNINYNSEPLRNAGDNTLDLVPQYSPNVRTIPQQQVQNVVRAQDNISNFSNQNVIGQQTYSNPNIPTTLKERNFAVNSLPQIPHMNNMNQNVLPQDLQPASYENYSRPQISNNQRSHSEPFNNVNSEMPQQNLQQNIALQPPLYNGSNLPFTYNQSNGHVAPNISSGLETVNQHANKLYHQDATNVQGTKPVCSARNLSNTPNTQASRYNIVNESSSAPNMSNNVSQGNFEGVPKVSREIRPVDNNAYNQGQEVNQNLSGGDNRHRSEEDSLPHGYPPQFTNDIQSEAEKPQVSTKLERPRSLSIQKSEDEVGEVALKDQDATLQNNAELTSIENNTKMVKINENTVSENLPSQEVDDVAGTKTPSHLTDQGYFDIKFYHNKLW